MYFFQRCWIKWMEETPMFADVYIMYVTYTDLEKSAAAAAVMRDNKSERVMGSGRVTCIYTYIYIQRRAADRDN